MQAQITKRKSAHSNTRSIGAIRGFVMLIQGLEHGFHGQEAHRADGNLNGRLVNFEAGRVDGLAPPCVVGRQNAQQEEHSGSERAKAGTAKIANAVNYPKRC